MKHLLIIDFRVIVDEFGLKFGFIAEWLKFQLTKNKGRFFEGIRYL